MPIFVNLRQARYSLTFVGVAFLVFDVSYYLMSTLPGSRNNMCIDGANLTPLNVSFSLLMSVMVGLLIAGMLALFSQKYAENKAMLSSMSGVGLLLGLMSTFCTLCSLPVLSFFGLSVGLEFITHHDVLIKGLSLISMATALYMLNKQLKNECAVCVVEPVTEVA